MERAIIAFWAVAFAASLVFLYPQEKPVQLRIGTLKSMATVHPYVAAELGLFDKEGISYRIYSFGTTPALMEAMAAGEIDVAYASVLPTMIWRGNGVDLRIVAGASKGGDIIVARPEFAGNLSGRRMASSNKGTMTAIMYVGFAKPKIGAEPVFGVEPADMPTALLVTKGVEAAITWEPFATVAEENGAVVVMDLGEEWKKEYGDYYPRNVLVVRAGLMENKSLFNALMRIHNKTTAFLNTPDADPTIAKVLNIKGAKKRLAYDASIDWEGMQREMQMAYDLGLLKRIITKEEVIYEEA